MIRYDQNLDYEDITQGQYTLTHAGKTVTIDSNYSFNLGSDVNEGTLTIGKQTLTEEDIEDMFALINAVSYTHLTLPTTPYV